MSSSSEAAPPVSAWSPFRYRAFALLWFATLISNVGTWMHEVGAGWLMTELSPSPAVVSLVQAATTLPVFLFALFAGTLADRLDKRRMLIVINVIMMVIVAALALLVQLQAITPLILILFTLAVGTGAAFMAPAWQAVVPSLIPRDNLQSAIALNSMGINISRAIGPALAGVLIVSVGLSTPFVVNAISHLVIIAALLMWKPEAAPRKIGRQPILAEMATGLRHARYNHALLATLIRAAAFFLFASAYWAMLPLIARSIPDGGAELYGLLLTLVGAGAVSGAIALPRLRGDASADQVVIAGTGGTAVALVLLAVANNPGVAMLASFVGGFAWIAVLTTFHVSAQLALPNWVRARGMAIFLMVFFGSMALGATLWGQVAQAYGLSLALVIAAAGLVFGAAITRKAKLGQGENLDLSPAMLWPAAPDLDLNTDQSADRAARVQIEYRIRPEDRTAFVPALKAWSAQRYRDGAFKWSLIQSVEDPEIWIESFEVASWNEHLAQHERLTVSDSIEQAEIKKFDIRETGPVVRHYLHF
ncbi:MFS transporter [Ruegeria arenilitoris]|uniref:MFS transporter n=1 Tax=Ruegeria arenilitoris TaxID=1173585 RepID=UPI00147A9C16|nr:MFS transporter [Ruegeria arenilitoris]